MLKKIFATFLVVVLAVGFVSCGKNKDTEEKKYSSADIVAESENFQFTRAELSYMFYQNYNDFCEYNKSYMQYFGFDTSTSLKEQSYSDDMTWFEYFAKPTMENLQQVLVLCEGAKAAGIELDEQDQSEIDVTYDSYKKYAEDYEYDLEELIKDHFGRDMSSDALLSCLKKIRLSLKYQDKLVSEYDFSNEDISEYLNNNTDDFYYIDYLSYTFDEDIVASAAAKAQELSAITDAASFEEYVRTFEMEILNKSEDEIDLSGLSNMYVLKDTKNPFSIWAFDGAQSGTTYIDKNDVDGIYTVYLLTKAPYLQDYTTKNFRYVYLTLDTYGTYDKALERANELVNTWRAGDADANSFGELAYNYSEDGATYRIGGIQENLDMMPSKFPTAVVNWLYDASRQTGDVDVIKGDNAYFIVYFEGDGQVQWESQARASLVEEKYDADVEALSEKFEIKTYDEVVDSLVA